MPYLAAAIVAPDIKPSDNKKKHDAVHVHTRINQSRAGTFFSKVSWGKLVKPVRLFN